MVQDTNQDGPRARTRSSTPAPADAGGLVSDVGPMEVRVKLQWPITINTVEVHELTMRRPRVKDRMNVTRLHGSKNAEDQEIIFVANLCGVMPDDIENLMFADWVKLQEQLGDFLSSRP